MIVGVTTIVTVDSDGLALVEMDKPELEVLPAELKFRVEVTLDDEVEADVEFVDEVVVVVIAPFVIAAGTWTMLVDELDLIMLPKLAVE